jgi:hypothetical protein
MPFVASPEETLTPKCEPRAVLRKAANTNMLKLNCALIKNPWLSKDDLHTVRCYEYARAERKLDLKLHNVSNVLPSYCHCETEEACIRHRPAEALLLLCQILPTPPSTLRGKPHNRPSPRYAIGRLSGERFPRPTAKFGGECSSLCNLQARI